MYRENDYYRFLRMEIERYNFSKIDGMFRAVLNKRIEKEMEWLDYNFGIVRECDGLVNHKTTNVVAHHAMLYKFIRKDFNLDGGRELVQMGITYTLLCCVIDKLIDESDYVARKPYVEILKRFTLGKKFDTSGLEGNEILCKLFDAVNNQYMRIAAKYPLLNEIIMEVSDRAIKSEVFVSEHNLLSMGMGTRKDVTDKSTQFTAAGILIACMDIGESKLEGLLKCSQEIGNILLYVDDMSDLYEDIDTLQVNSLVYDVDKRVNDENDIEEALDQIINSVENMVVTVDLYYNALSRYLSKPTTDYMKFIIVNWLEKILAFDEQLEKTGESSNY